MRTRRHLMFLLVLPLALAGCREAKVAEYRVPKEKDPELPMAGGADSTNGAGKAGAAAADTEVGPPPGRTGAGASMADTAVPTASGPELSWTAPGSWVVKPPSAMRKGSYSVKGEGGEADLSITAFPGDVGGELANVNRWRGQVLLPPLTDATLAGSVTHVSQNGLQFTLVDLAGGGQGAGGQGAGAQRILGAIVPFADGTWFFKLTGPDALVSREKDEFTAFLKTVKPAGR